jgi:signal transduction histidine kinase/CheY-like chemotaxis protein/HPt (histidine-containing phosphotransfer) domain-containing protein
MSASIKHKLKASRNSLSMRIVLATLVYSLLIALVVTAIQITFTYRQNLSVAKERFSEIEKGYVPSLARGLWEVNNANVEALLDSIAQIPHVGKIILTDETSYQFIRNETKKNAFSEQDFTLRFSENNTSFDVGQLHIELSNEAIQAQLIEQAVRTAIITLTTLLIGSLCVLILFQRLVSRHLHTMADFARDFDVNNLDVKLQLQRPANTEVDELDVVEHAINEMQSRLKNELVLRGAVEQELRSHKENLESIVELRTQELREAKEIADTANAAKSSFLANMSHEIRTPMNAVLGMLQLIQKTALNERQQDYIIKAYTAAKSLLGLLNDILDFSKIDVGKLQLENHPFEMEALMRELAVVLSGNQAGKNIEVMFDLDTSLPNVLVSDRLRLQQILINLAGNALKFTAQGHVLISVNTLTKTDATATLRIAVADTGIGISPEQQARIFDGFVQAEASTTRRFGGTGLGLAISKRLVDLFGGTLQLESELGQGSRFWFDITLAVGEPMVPQVSDNVTSLAGLHILVVDDNDTSREVLYRTIAALGGAADVADSGRMALDLVSKVAQQGKPYDVILMDLSMPLLDGLGTAAIIQKMPLLKSPAIIMVTAFGRDEVGEKQLSGTPPYCDFLTKPVTPNQISDAIIRAASAVPAVIAALPPTASFLPLAELRLLVVEDNELNSQIAFELLTGMGAEVILAAGGIEGVEKVVSSIESFDVVIMDVQMPDIDGLEATRRIRANKKFATLPILAMTANASQEDREDCLAAGMTDHIGKPIDIDEVVERILALVGRTTKEPSIFHGEVQPALLADNVEAIRVVLKRFNGNLELYGRMLAGFPDNMKVYLEKLLQEENKIEAAKILHSIKGLAGTMGAKGLADKASDLEKHCKNDAALEIGFMYDSAIQILMSSYEFSVRALNEQLHEYKLTMDSQGVGPSHG